MRSQARFKFVCVWFVLWLCTPPIFGKDLERKSTKSESDGLVRRFQMPSMKKIDPGHRVEIIEAGAVGTRQSSMLSASSAVKSLNQKQQQNFDSYSSESGDEDENDEENEMIPNGGSYFNVVVQSSQPAYAPTGRPIGPPVYGGYTSRPTGGGYYRPIPAGTTTTTTTTEVPPIVVPLPPAPNPEATTTMEPMVVGPPSTMPPVTAGTIVPIIGGGGTGGGEGGGGPGTELPPSPPETGGLPPSPPEQQAVRSNQFSPRALMTSTRNRPQAASFPATRAPSTRIRNFPLLSSTQMPRQKMRDKLREPAVMPVRKEEDTLVRSNEADLPLDSDVITDFEFSDIKCFKKRDREYFGTTIHLKRGFHLPYIRDRPQDPLSSKECRMERVDVDGNPSNSFHMSVTDLKGCGVEPCGEAMCLTMVFPRVPTLALADDEVTTIKCIPQKSTMSDTKSISFAGDTLENRRSSSTVEGGVQDFAAEVGVFRQNPGTKNGMYNKRVISGGVVQLGETLQLRSVVRGGNGWNHSKLTDVKVWRMRDNYSHNVDNLDPNDASEVITLVDGKGCRNDEYKVIADSHPLRDPKNELLHHFAFKAFLFRGQRANEPLIVTAKVQACQERMDCLPDDCVHSVSDVRRHRRSPSPTEVNNASAIVHDWSSKMALRVVGLKDHPSSLTEEDFPFEYQNKSESSPSTKGEVKNQMSCKEKMAVSGLGGSLIALLICGMILGLHSFIRKGKKAAMENMGNFQNTFAVALPPPPQCSSAEDANNNNNGKHPNMTGRTPSLHQDIIRQSEVGKPPLPLPPSNSSSKDTSSVVGTKSELSEVAKLLQQLRNNTSDGKSEGPSEYAVIGEEGGDNTSTSGSESPDGKKGDGVYIVYCCNNKDKKKRPTSAPPTLREKKRHSNSGRGSQKDGNDDISVDSLDTTEDSDGIYGKSRRTVRSVKRTQKNRSGAQQLRRRLSSFYKDHAINKGCSFPARYKKPSSRHVTFGKSSQERNYGSQAEYSDGIYSSAQLSSDIDSAYYGSIANEDSSTYCLSDEMQGFHHHNNNANQFRGQMNMNGSTANGNNIPFQLRQGNSTLPRNLGVSANKKHQSLIIGGGVGGFNGGMKNASNGNINIMNEDSGPVSLPSLGQTTATHFVTRNDSSTQIIIVPETHV